MITLVIKEIESVITHSILKFEEISLLRKIWYSMIGKKYPYTRLYYTTVTFCKDSINISYLANNDVYIDRERNNWLAITGYGKYRLSQIIPSNEPLNVTSLLEHQDLVCVYHAYQE